MTIERILDPSEPARQCRLLIRRSDAWRETLGAGPTWETAQQDASEWQERRAKLRACTMESHRTLRARLHRVLRGHRIPDPRSAHWMRTRRAWRGKGWLGECCCGSSILIVDRFGDLEFTHELAHAIAQRHGLVPAALFASNRDRRSVEARADLARELRRMGWSYPRIGSVLGRHHTSVMHLVKEVGV